MKTKLSEDSMGFLEFWRQQYEWPIGAGRKNSEQRIVELRNRARNAITCRETGHIQEVLVDIHRWKTNNRSGVSERYERMLTNNKEVVPFLQNNFPLMSSTFSSTFIKELLDTLKIRYCNLPICSAQSSFLLNRNLPILDRFVSQFFSLTISKSILNHRQFSMSDVLQDIDPISFKIEDDGTGRRVPRLAVYQEWGYKANRSLYIDQFVPQLVQIAGLLNKEEVKYKDFNNVAQGFSCVDIEMAVFAFAIKNRQYFEGFYDKSPTNLNL